MRVLCNRAGANMVAGVASALLSGGAADWAVLEADELSTIHILPQLRPTYLVLLNLFRDQLDRAGEIDHVQDTIVAALAASPSTTLVTCGDDPLSMGVAVRAAQAGIRVLTFGMGEDLGLAPDRVPEARFCQVCDTELRYEYRSYAQLGKFACPNCGFARPELDFVATAVAVDREGVSFDFSRPGEGTRRIHADFGGVYMAYNLLAAAAAASLAGVDAAHFQQALDGYHPANGRLQRFDVDGREVVLNLAKNPTGFNQNLSLLLADDRPKAAFLVVNDNYNDGRDISWIWDVDFERLTGGEGMCRVIAGGHRANDVQVRLKYAGIEARIADSVGEALRQVGDLPAEWPLYVLTNYSALWPAKDELESLGEHHG
jgi:UDP-N-acetylmuramyl tripeptide synthase